MKFLYCIEGGVEGRIPPSLCFYRFIKLTNCNLKLLISVYFFIEMFVIFNANDYSLVRTKSFFTIKNLMNYISFKPEEVQNLNNLNTMNSLNIIQLIILNCDWLDCC